MKSNNKSIRDFFKPHTVPTNRIPTRPIEEEIIVASPTSPKRNARNSNPQARTPSSLNTTPTKQSRDRPRKPSNDPPKRLRLTARSSELPTRPSPKQHASDNIDATERRTSASSSLTPLESSPSTPSTVRKTTVIEIPSPSPKMAASESSAHPIKDFSASFGSISTLSSIRSSQSSSRRIVKDGVPAVTNSDSGSISSASSDDEDGLADISTFIPRKKRKVTPPGSDRAHAIEVLSTAKPTRSSNRLSNKHDFRKTRRPWDPPTPPATAVKYKHSLANLVKNHTRQEQSEQKIKEAERQMEEARLADEAAARNEEALAEGAENATAVGLLDDADDGERMIQAMQRTEALKKENHYHFFYQEEDTQMADEVEFPHDELQKEDCRHLSFLQDEEKRTDACRSGFLADLAFWKGLPRSVIQWLKDSIAHEPEEELRDAFIGVLDVVVKRDGLNPKAGAILLGKTYCCGQGSPEQNRWPTSKLPTTLPSVIRAISTLTSSYEDSERVETVVDLVRLNVDHSVRQSPDIQLLVEDALIKVVESAQYRDDTYKAAIERLLNEIKLDKHLACHMASSLPATSPNLHAFRRLFALYIFVGPAANTHSPMMAKHIIKQLEKDRVFAISDQTDYTHLLYRIDALDVAIDVGFSDFAFLSRPREPERQKSVLTKSQPAPDEEQQFNAQVDALANRFRAMASKIRDSGTSHLKRTEAKSAIERLVMRLEFSVRTKPKPRKGVFGGTEGSGLQKGLMQGFLQRTAAGGNHDTKAGAEVKDVEMKDFQRERVTAFKRKVSGTPGEDARVMDENAHM